MKIGSVYQFKIFHHKINLGYIDFMVNLGEQNIGWNSHEIFHKNSLFHQFSGEIQVTTSCPCNNHKIDMKLCWQDFAIYRRPQELK